MPSPALGHTRKHSNHIALLLRMMEDRVPERVRKAPSLRYVYELMLRYPGIGPFLAFQYTIDLNYSSLLDFDEAEFVVAGPGALDGISKCFADARGLSAEDIIYWMTDRQHAEFERLGLAFPGLYGRRLQPIDCQNIFCEISKYARVAHPEVVGVANRTRIKQTYRPCNLLPPVPQFPARWRLPVAAASTGLADSFLRIPDRLGADAGAAAGEVGGDGGGRSTRTSPERWPNPRYGSATRVDLLAHASARAGDAASGGQPGGRRVATTGLARH